MAFLFSGDFPTSPQPLPHIIAPQIHKAFIDSMQATVRHERREGRKGLEVSNCLTDEGRSLGTGLQEQVSNHLKLRW